MAGRRPRRTEARGDLSARARRALPPPVPSSPNPPRREGATSVSALAPGLILDAVEAMSPGERRRLAALLGPFLSSVGETPIAHRWLTVAEAAAMAGVCEETIRRKVNAGELPDRRIGARIRIAREDLEALLDDGAPGPSASPQRRRRTGGGGAGALAEAFLQLSD